MLGFGTERVDTPLSEPLPSVPGAPRASVPSVAPKLQTDALEAGTKVAAIDTVSPVSTLALVFPSGSAYETDANAGASKLLETMAFKATANRTTFRCDQRTILDFLPNNPGSSHC
jgi:processing peptidase subunit alpha